MVCSARQLVVVSRSLVGTVMVPCRYYKCPRTEILFSLYTQTDLLFV